jgi:uncharacterized protein YndB with AHSA1/START domain
MGITTEASLWINATPEAVFAKVGDPAGHGDWSAKAPLQVQRLGDGPIAVGSEFVSTSQFLGKPVTANLRVTQYDPPKRIAFAAEHPEGTYHHEFALEPADGGTKLTRTITIPPGSGIKALLVKYVAPGAIRKEALKAMNRLKQQIE